MRQKFSLVIIGISIVVIASWIFLIVPDLKNNPEYFELLLQAEVELSIANEIGAPLSPPLHLQTTISQKIIENNGSTLKIKSLLQMRDYVTKEIFQEIESIELVDRLTRKYVDKDNVYVILPYNTQKQSYNFWSFGGNPLEINFVRTDNIHGLDVYLFKSVTRHDMTGAFPQFGSETIFSDLEVLLWIEPITGQFVRYEAIQTSKAIQGNEEILLATTHGVVSDYSSNIVNEGVRIQKDLFYLYDTIIPILLVIISVGFVLVVFVNQNLRARTEELKETRKKKVEEVLYEIIPDFVITLDKNNLIENCNQKIIDEFGFSKDEVIGKPAVDFILEEEQKKYLDIVQRIRNGEQVMEYDLHSKRKDGGFNHSIWNCMPMFDENNEYEGYVTTGVDLTEIDKLRDELVKKEKFAILGQLAANIAHDIRNPLAVLKNSMHFIQKSPNPQTVQREQPRVDRSIDRIVHQVEDVLEYVGFSPLQFTKKSIREILTSSYYSMSISENIIVTFPDNDIKIECDDKKLERVFVNILLNATQAIGSDKGSIDLRIHDKDDRIEIEFENSGPNIDEENLDKIFEPLFTTKMEGTGLGLAGCKNIVNLHGGIISVTSPPTIFRIELPKSQ